MSKIRKITLILILFTSQPNYANPLVALAPAGEVIQLDYNEVCELTLQRNTTFQNYLYFLKKKLRNGFLQRGVPREEGETIWQHVQMLVKAAKILAKNRGLDPREMAFIALVHDLAEAIVPDYTPIDNIPKGVKSQIEAAAMRVILSNIKQEDPDLANRVSKAWLDYEHKRTPEARLVKQLDKFDAALRASTYERRGYPRMEEFYQSPISYLEDEKLKALFHKFVEVRLKIDDPYSWYFANLQ